MFVILSEDYGYGFFDVVEAYVGAGLYIDYLFLIFA